MQSRIVNYPILFWGILALTASACTNLSLGDAVDLGQTGSQAANTYATSLTQTRTQIDAYVEAQFLVAPLRGIPAPGFDWSSTPDCSQHDLDTGRNIQCVELALSARAQMMRQLAATYQAFGALASYDAGGDVKTSLQNLDGAVNSFASAVGQPGVPAVTGTAVIEVGSLLVVDLQKKKVKRASALIRQRLAQIVPLLKKERSALEQLESGLVNDAGATAAELWRYGIGVPDPILADNVGNFGLAYSAGGYSHACDDKTGDDKRDCQKTFKTAIRQVVILRAKRQARDQMIVIDSNTRAIEDLIAAHEQLESGQGLNLATINQQIATVQAIVSEIAAAKGAKPSSK